MCMNANHWRVNFRGTENKAEKKKHEKEDSTVVVLYIH